MKKQKRKENKVESEFLTSMLFLMVSLGASLTVFLTYSTTNSFNVEVQELVAEQKPQNKTPVVKAIEKSIDIPKEKSEKIVASKSVPNTVSASDTDSSESVKKAIELVNQSQVAEAKLLLEKVLQDNPEHEEALTQLGLIHLLDYKDAKAAQPYFEKILSINPDNKLALAELVDIYADFPDGGGVKYLESLYEKNQSASIAAGIGQVLIENNPKAAIPYLEKGGEHALNDLGDAYSMSGNYAKALETYQVQEEKAKAKLQNADPETSEYTKDELVRVMMNQYHTLRALGNDEQAQQKQNELRQYIGKEADLLTQSEQPHSKMKKEPNF